MNSRPSEPHSDALPSYATPRPKTANGRDRSIWFNRNPENRDRLLPLDLGIVAEVRSVWSGFNGEEGGHLSEGDGRRERCHHSSIVVSKWIHSASAWPVCKRISKKVLHAFRSLHKVSAPFRHRKRRCGFARPITALPQATGSDGRAHEGDRPVNFLFCRENISTANALHALCDRGGFFGHHEVASGEVTGLHEEGHRRPKQLRTGDGPRPWRWSQAEDSQP